jgi:hypothetical protein
MKPYPLILFLLSVPLFGESQSIIIPAVHIPARHIPAIHIPGKHIPAKQTAFGLIDAIEIPAVDIPAIDIPAVDTTATTFIYGDFKEDNVAAYRRSSPVSKVQPQKFEKTFSERRAEKYLASTKWATSELVDLFTRFDTDHSGVLSWNEVEMFQRYIFNRFKYISNDTALRPDEFLAAGGGDCEDWALLSCEFFRYWGWDAVVAGFFNAKEGHAVCFVRAEESIPSGYLKYYLTATQTIEGDKILEGWYVPVDYFQVGNYSNAVQAGMKLTKYFTPAKIYDAVM